MSKVIPVILSGGIGSRLWPLSREAHPKPFIKLSDGQSLIQKTYIRALALNEVEEVITVTNRDLCFYTKDEFLEVASNSISVHHTFLLEPFGRNSTAAIALAAHYAKSKHGDDCVLLVLPADHLISNQPAFAEAVKDAVALALQGKLVTFGIKPDSPQTSFGYIEADGVNVTRFVEKPDLETAKKYVLSGNFFWNSGMFCMGAGTFLQELQQLRPDIAKQTFVSFGGAAVSQGEGYQQVEIDPVHFQPIQNISVDYAIFEPSTNVAVVSCDIGWSDIGSWNEFGALQSLDADGNHIAGNTLLENVQNCIIHSETRLVAALGLDNLIIADTVDALLIAHRDNAQDVRNIVSTLKQREDTTFRLFPTVHRPWGAYTVLLEETGFKLKRIEVKSGAALSLQSHKHRSEHWVVVSGTAQVTNGNSVLVLERNQSTYIPAGSKHRLVNSSDDTLYLIEVQCGEYLGEDDIVRYEDTYGRDICP